MFSSQLAVPLFSLGAHQISPMNRNMSFYVHSRMLPGFLGVVRTSEIFVCPRHHRQKITGQQSLNCPDVNNCCEQWKAFKHLSTYQLLGVIGEPLLWHLNSKRTFFLFLEGHDLEGRIVLSKHPWLWESPSGFMLS